MVTCISFQFAWFCSGLRMQLLQDVPTAEIGKGSSTLKCIISYVVHHFVVASFQVFPQAIGRYNEIWRDILRAEGE